MGTPNNQSISPWALRGNLGRPSTVICPTGVTSRLRLVKAQIEGDLPYSQPLSLSVYYVNPLPAGGTALLDVRLVVSFGSGGSLSEVRFDFSSGMTICVPCTAIEAWVEITNNTGANITISMAGALTVGACSTQSRHTYSIDFPVIASTFIRIPNFAREVAIMQQTETNDFWLEFEMPNVGLYAGNVFRRINPGRELIWYPIPMGCRQVQLVKNAEVGDALGRVVGVFSIDM